MMLTSGPCAAARGGGLAVRKPSTSCYLWSVAGKMFIPYHLLMRLLLGSEAILLRLPVQSQQRNSWQLPRGLGVQPSPLHSFLQQQFLSNAIRHHSNSHPQQQQQCQLTNRTVRSNCQRSLIIRPALPPPGGIGRGSPEQVPHTELWTSSRHQQAA